MSQVVKFVALGDFKGYLENQTKVKDFLKGETYETKDADGVATFIKGGLVKYAREKSPSVKGEVKKVDEIDPLE